MACALWYWSHFSVFCEVHETEGEAASDAVAMEDAETASVAGVQYEDGRFVDRGSWDAYQAEQDRRTQQWQDEWAKEEKEPKPAMREVDPPFDARGQKARVLESTPGWIGAH